MSSKFIDIEKLFRDKNPGALKWLPRFVLNYLKRIIHQDEINDFMHRHQNDNAYEFTSAVVREFNVKPVVKGLENIPTEGGIILVSNHPLGGFDAMTLVPQIEEVRKDLKFIVNDILLNIGPMRELFTGVNKVGKTAQSSLANVEELFASDNAVFIFPAGLVSRKIKGKVMDLEWKKTFITRAIKYNKPVIPIYVDGRLSNFFYNLSNFRTSLGIKANIEMLYLANEMMKQKNKTIWITIGEPISAATFTKEKTHKQWAEYVREKVYKLKEQHLLHEKSIS